jgi:hypothetical protein
MVLEREKKPARRSLQGVARMKCIDELSGKCLKSVVQPGLFLRISHHFLFPAVETTRKKIFYNAKYLQLISRINCTIQNMSFV